MRGSEAEGTASGLAEAGRVLGDPAALELLGELVRLAPTNLEDPAHGRYEKPRYAVTAEHLLRVAREWGFSARVFDPTSQPEPDPSLHGIPRPNLIIDHDVGAAERVLILAHYDVVPVPAEQLGRWNSPPHELTARANGRLYGRGSNDDLGSGVVASLLALKALKAAGDSPRNVRLLICCDEETGGAGGIETLKAADDLLPPGDPGRVLLAQSALIPDGSPEVCAGSSGVLFLDAGFARPVPYETIVNYGLALVRLHDLAREWKSSYLSPDWPDHHAPEEHLTGRATVTKFDLTASPDGAYRPRLTRVHAETDATNQIAQTVTFVFEGPGEKLVELRHWLSRQVRPPFRLARTTSTALEIPTGALAVSVIGRSYHAGYPHLAHNPVPVALQLLEDTLMNAKIEDEPLASAFFGVDLRLPPEMALEEGRRRALEAVHHWTSRYDVGATIEAPLHRQRGGYALSPSHPTVTRLAGIMSRTFGVHGVFGEYGGTDASSLLGVRTPSGEPMPALVFGSMDREAHIHEAEESVDPKLLAQVVATIVAYVREP
jgi:acetylornithine deacetylase/succinyl-diaminopimelate desuccinylase-like protein